MVPSCHYHFCWLWGAVSLFPCHLMALELKSWLMGRTNLALTRGKDGNFPCPICRVPRDEQHDLSTQWPLRTAQESQEAYETAHALYGLPRSKGKAEKVLKDLGLRYVKVLNIYWYSKKQLIFQNPLECILEAWVSFLSPSCFVFWCATLFWWWHLGEASLDWPSWDSGSGWKVGCSWWEVIIYSILISIT